MKLYVSAFAVLALSACSGSSPVGGPASTPPDATLNSDFGTLMNNARMAAGEPTTLFYDARVAQAAQDHANDMLANNHNTVFINGNAADGDIGDRLNALNYSWQDFIPLLDQGEETLQNQANDFNSRMCTNVIAAECVAQPDFDDFGIARAGSGTAQRWVLIITDPQ